MNPGISSGRVRMVRVACVVLGVMLWMGTQWLIGQRDFPAADVESVGKALTAADALHQATESWNRQLHEHDGAARALLVISSALIDVMAISLFASAIFGRSLRPFLGLLFLFGSRQVCQFLCPLPPPEGIIWSYPGVPSLLVTYGVSNDFFFSGHTAIATFAGLELGRRGGRRWWGLGVFLISFQATVVLVLRAHYTLDVITGVVFAVLAHPVADRIAGAADRLVSRVANRGGEPAGEINSSGHAA